MKKRIYLILSGENLFHPTYCLGLIKRINKERYQIVGITIPREHFPKGFLFFIRQQIILWGLHGFLFIALTDRIRNILTSIKTVSRKYNIPVISTADVNSKEHIDYLKSQKIDIIISSQGQIFKEELLRLPKIACINRHTSLLPLYGGSMPVFWAMYHREKNFGVSIHFMVRKIDAGDVLAQKKLPLLPSNSLFRNYITAFNTSIDVTITALNNLEKNKIVKKFRFDKKKYFFYPKFDVVKSFKKKQKTFSLSDIVSFIEFSKQV